MDIGTGAIIGVVYKWIFNWLKSKLGWADAGATWTMLAGGLLLALLYNIFTGGFAGLTFDPADIGQTLASVGSAWGIISGTAMAWFSVTKKRG